MDVLVSLLEDEEVRELGLEQEPELCRAEDIEFVSFPIRDRAAPESTPSALALIETIRSRLVAGKGVVIHCRIGIGRSAMMAAAVLVQSDRDAERAFSAIGEARGVPVPDTDEQREWVRRVVWER